LVVTNHLLGRRYPSKGTAVGVVDTGFEGFLVVPESAFGELGLDQLKTSVEMGSTADGRQVQLRSFPGSVELKVTGGSYDGKVLTGPGIDEILVGTLLLARLKVTLNYCSGVVRVEPCA
jgi:clan AA aspartic protease